MALAGSLATLALVLGLTTVPGIFTIDENNFMVSVLSLREGGFEVPGTEKLTRSKELAYFAPQPDRFVVREGPLTTDAPALYAFFALPFSLFGWSGLFWVNIVALVAVAACVYLAVRAHSASAGSAGLAAALILGGGYCLEYAQAVWPHMLSAALCVGAFLAASKVRAGSPVTIAFLAGLLAGSAAGIREQNIVFAGGVGLTLLLLGPHRFRSSLVFGLGVLVMLLLMAWVNLERSGVFHPVPKSTAYVSALGGQVQPSQPSGRSSLEPLKVLWTKVIDFSTHPVPQDTLEARFFHREEASGAIMTGTVVKKALLQSSPWIGAALLAVLGAWWGWVGRASPRRKELMAISLVIGPVLAMIAFAGYAKTDGISHNQRYLLETVPLLAIAVGLALEDLKMNPVVTFMGFVAGVLAAFVSMLIVQAPFTYVLIVNAPLALGLALLVAMVLARHGKAPVAFSVLLGCALGWALFVHLADDVRGVNSYRRANLERTELFDSVVPDHSAIVAWGGSKDAAGPLQMHKDVVILDAWADRGQDAPMLVRELLSSGRRVFVLANLMPEKLLQAMTEGLQSVRANTPGMTIIEIMPAGSPEPQTNTVVQ